MTERLTTSAAVPAPAPTAHATGAGQLFAGAGEMRALCRAFDWAATPLGPVERWSPSLRTTVGIVLGSRNPMFLWWGPELVQVYNDAYRPSLGEGGRHPRALGMPAREFWTDIWDAIGPQIAQVMGGGEATWHEDQYLPIERNGRLEDVWWTYSYSPVLDDDGSIGGTLVVCQETTRRVLAERERERLLRALEVERSRLADVFRQAPAFLAVLRGPEHVFDLVNDAYYQLVGHRELVGRAAFDALPEVRDQGFQELLDSVLATGEPFVGRELPLLVARTPEAPLEARFVDLTYLPLVEGDGTRAGIIAHGTDVTEQVRARREVERLLGESEQARAKGLILAVADCPPVLAARADAEKLRQILVNLLSNAVKFTDAGGRIQMSCAVEGARVVVRVRDTGIGIPADKLEAIFDPFVQVRANLTRPHEGTGLGLAISRDLARGMAGDLTAESTPSVGSTFTLMLPRA